jgi:outer membrane lipoprotein-sorting protein
MTRSNWPHRLPFFPLWTALLTLGLGIGLPAQAQEEKLPAGNQIMEKSIEGRGGRAAFEKLKTRVSKGMIRLGGEGLPAGEGKATVYEAAPNKRYFLTELPTGGMVEAGSDGNVNWEILGPQSVKIYEGEEKAVKQRESTFNALLFWKEQYTKVECVGKEQVGEHSCYKVVLTPPVGTPETVYFDRKTLFPVRLDVVRKTPLGDTPIQIDQEDYKQVDGVWLPFKTVRHVAVMGQEQTITYTWDSIEHNADIPASRFDLPPAIKEQQANPESRPAKPGAAKPPQ